MTFNPFTPIFLFSFYFCFCFLLLCEVIAKEGRIGDADVGKYGPCVYCAGSVHPVANQVYEGRKKEKMVEVVYYQKRERVRESFFFPFQLLWKVYEK